MTLLEVTLYYKPLEYSPLSCRGFLLTRTAAVDARIVSTRITSESKVTESVTKEDGQKNGDVEVHAEQHPFY